MAKRLKGALIAGAVVAALGAVAAGDIDAAIVWGPTAGYFAKRQPTPLVLSGVQPWLDGPLWPMVFDISMAVRKDDRALRRDLNRAIQKRRAEIDSILAAYHVPTSNAGMPAGPQRAH
jgi:mxaJ protein